MPPEPPQNSTSNGGPSSQISKTMGDISYSSHCKGLYQNGNAPVTFLILIPQLKSDLHPLPRLNKIIAIHSSTIPHLGFTCYFFSFPVHHLIHIVLCIPEFSFHITVLYSHYTLGYILTFFPLASGQTSWTMIWGVAWGKAASWFAAQPSVCRRFRGKG